MRKTLVLAGILLLIATANSMASQTDLFSYDAVTIDNQMAQLDQLEGYVLNNPGITLKEMATAGNSLCTLVTDPNGISGFTLINENVLGVPSFLWGCVFGPVGIILVYLVGEKDKAETKKASTGCLVSYGTAAVLYGISIVLSALSY
jgi:hypothetical protein